PRRSRSPGLIRSEESLLIFLSSDTETPVRTEMCESVSFFLTVTVPLFLARGTTEPGTWEATRWALIRASAALTMAGVAALGVRASRVGSGAASAGSAREPRTTAGIATVATALPMALTRLLCARDMERSFGLGQGRIDRSQKNAHGLWPMCVL